MKPLNYTPTRLHVLQQMQNIGEMQSDYDGCIFYYHHKTAARWCVRNGLAVERNEAFMRTLLGTFVLKACIDMLEIIEE